MRSEEHHRHHHAARRGRSPLAAIRAALPATQSKVTSGAVDDLRGGGEVALGPAHGDAAAPQKGDLIGTVIVVRDVSEVRGITRQTSYQASDDVLDRPGQPTRVRAPPRRSAASNWRISNEARHVPRYLDLDCFKAVNDSCAHMAGDGMLPRGRRAYQGNGPRLGDRRTWRRRVRSAAGRLSCWRRRGDSRRRGQEGRND